MVSENLRLKMLSTEIKGMFDARWKDVKVQVRGTKLRISATPILRQVKFSLITVVYTDSIVPVLTCKDVDLESKINEFARKVVKTAEEDRDFKVKISIM